MSKDDSEQAKQLLVRAIDLSPRYAKAHALLAWAEADAVLRGVSSASAALPVARQHARTALALDDDDPWTFCAAGFIETLASRYEDAIAAFHQAIKQNPNFALAHGWVGTALSLRGNPDDAVEAIDRAMRMSPRDPFNALLLHSAAVAHFAAERYAEGIACERKALRERPNFAAPRRFLAACLVNLGELEEAHAVIAELLLVQPNSSIKGDAYGYGVFAQSSVQERYVEALRKAGLPEE
jgi:adenylate cyclase